MDWGAISAIAQVVAAVGVILTLFYLAMQIRQNTGAIRRAAYQELLNYITNVNLKLASDRELCVLFIEVRDGLDRLEEADQMRLVVWFGSVFRHYLNVYNLYSENVISREQWATMSSRLGAHLQSQGGRAMWARVRPGFPAAFQRVVDSQIDNLTPD